MSTELQPALTMGTLTSNSPTPVPPFALSFIGDTLRDYEAAKAANVKPIILNKLNLKIVDYKYKNDLTAAVKYIKKNDSYKNSI